jgi:hypothetical protein
MDKGKAMKAEEIKKAIQTKKSQKLKSVEEAEILGVKGFLYRSSSFEMEGWRACSNALNKEGEPDENKRRLSPSKLIQISFRDEDGLKVFEELDLPFIGGIEDSEINRVFKRCLAINGYGGEGIEALLKNLVAIVGVDGVYASLVSIGCPCPNCTQDTRHTSSESNGSANSTGQQVRRQKPTEPSSSAK